MKRSEAEAYARANGMMFLETSAKTKVGINQVFEEAAEKVRPRGRLRRCVHTGFVVAHGMTTVRTRLWREQILDNPRLLASTVPAAKRGVTVNPTLQEQDPGAGGGCCG